MVKTYSSRRYLTAVLHAVRRPRLELLSVFLDSLGMARFFAAGLRCRDAENVMYVQRHVELCRSTLPFLKAFLKLPLFTAPMLTRMHDDLQVRAKRDESPSMLIRGRPAEMVVAKFRAAYEQRMLGLGAEFIANVAAGSVDYIHEHCADENVSLVAYVHAMTAAPTEATFDALLLWAEPKDLAAAVPALSASQSVDAQERLARVEDAKATAESLSRAMKEFDYDVLTRLVGGEDSTGRVLERSAHLTHGVYVSALLEKNIAGDVFDLLVERAPKAILPTLRRVFARSKYQSAVIRTVMAGRSLVFFSWTRFDTLREQPPEKVADLRRLTPELSIHRDSCAVLLHRYVAPLVVARMTSGQLSSVLLAIDSPLGMRRILANIALHNAPEGHPPVLCHDAPALGPASEQCRSVRPAPPKAHPRSRGKAGAAFARAAHEGDLDYMRAHALDTDVTLPVLIQGVVETPSGPAFDHLLENVDEHVLKAAVERTGGSVDGRRKGHIRRVLHASDTLAQAVDADDVPAMISLIGGIDPHNGVRWPRDGSLTNGTWAYHIARSPSRPVLSSTAPLEVLLLAKKLLLTRFILTDHPPRHLESAIASRLQARQRRRDELLNPASTGVGDSNRASALQRRRSYSSNS